MDRVEVKAMPRSQHGTRPVRRLRSAGVVPGVVYGKSVEPTPISLNRRDLVKLLHGKSGEHGLITLHLEADGKATKGWQKPVLIKRVEHHPVDGQVLHIDFQAIALTERIRVKVAVTLTGTAIGVKQDGGILEHFLREVEVECLPTEIPAQIEQDISALTIGDAIHAKDLVVPQGVRLMTDLAAVIVSVIAPKVEKPEEAAEAAPTEPEVIREKKPDAEGEEAGDAKGGKAEAKGGKSEEKEKKEK